MEKITKYTEIFHFCPTFKLALYVLTFRTFFSRLKRPIGTFVRTELLVNSSRYKALVKEENIIFPPLHLKLGLMKNFVKALARDPENRSFAKNQSRDFRWPGNKKTTERRGF